VASWMVLVDGTIVNVAIRRTGAKDAAPDAG
jgi:hypothetical protein